MLPLIYGDICMKILIIASQYMLLSIHWYSDGFVVVFVSSHLAARHPPEHRYLIQQYLHLL